MSRNNAICLLTTYVILAVEVPIDWIDKTMRFDMVNTNSTGNQLAVYMYVCLCLYTYTVNIVACIVDEREKNRLCYKYL